MAEPHVITAPVKKRADLAGETPKRRVRGRTPHPAQTLRVLATFSHSGRRNTVMAGLDTARCAGPGPRMALLLEESRWFSARIISSPRRKSGSSFRRSEQEAGFRRSPE
jgi:hypothetical protein